MNTKLTGINGGVQRSNAMVRLAQFAGSSSTAAVTWYGYDAPQGVTAAAHDSYAESGAPLLDNFQTGLRVTHEGTPSHNTVVGHSYGTTVVGMSASHGNTLDVNDVVFVASPGVAVDHASDFRITGVPKGQAGKHVYATVAEYDPIRLVSGVNGGAPTDSDFGGTEFHSDPDRGHLWLLGWNSSAHSAYWKPKNPSLKNICLIIAGYGGEVS